MIPVAKARFGFGGGGGAGILGEEGSRFGRGGGGGGIVTPIGYIEVRDRSSEFKRIFTPLDMLALVIAAPVALLALKRLLA